MLKRLNMVFGGGLGLGNVLFETNDKCEKRKKTKYYQ